jgi:hypothetical protein
VAISSAGALSVDSIAKLQDHFSASLRSRVGPLLFRDCVSVRVPMARARGRLATTFGGAAAEAFDQCDLDGDGQIVGRAEAEALRNLVVSGHPGLTATPRQWNDPLVISNALFVLAALQWWRRGYRRQGTLLFGCGVVCSSCSRASAPSVVVRAGMLHS